MKRHLRNEKNCLNCGEEVTHRFCSYCGQENVVIKETFGELVADFFADVTHYDSKFFSTIKDLLFKPGFLSRQYFEGRRTKYLNPLRMYFFISFIFFFVLFLKKTDAPVSAEGYNNEYLSSFKQHLADSLRNSIKHNGGADTTKTNIINKLAADLNTAGIKKDTTENIAFGVGDKGVNVTLIENKYNTVHEYDSVQAGLPLNKRDKGFVRWIVRRNVELKSKYGSRSQVMVAESFEHSIPKLMFFLLPLFAWFIYLFYSHKKFYYAQHAIFSVHFHSFVFLLLLIVNLLSWLPFLEKVNVILLSVAYIVAFIYLISALKHAYEQPVWLSALKAIAISILYVIALIIGIVCLVFISFISA